MKRFVSLLVTTLLVLTGLLGYVFRQQIRDFVVVQTNTLPADTQTILSNLELTSDATFIYKASRPEVQSANEFNVSCGNVTREHSIVLGCYTRQRFFIYDVKDERLAGAKEVTAAHELLHAIYERLSDTERQALDKELVMAAEAIKDERFQSTIAQYRQSEPDQLTNEYHSILGTEITVLPASLEAHYKKYFTNRSKIIGYAQQYESAFTTLEQQIQDYDSRLAALRKQKDQLEVSLGEQQASIETEQKRLAALKSENNVSEYNAAVPAFNARVRAYNDDVTELKAVVADYNELVEKRNTVATTQNNLVQQLDSKYQPFK